MKAMSMSSLSAVRPVELPSSVVWNVVHAAGVTNGQAEHFVDGGADNQSGSVVIEHGVAENAGQGHAADQP
jgi:hypothetical protein